MERNDLLARITIDREICNGKPTIRGKRITAQTVLEFLSAGESREEILRQYPSLEPEDIDASIAFRQREREAWLEENREAIEAYNEHVAQHGVFSTGLRGF